MYHHTNSHRYPANIARNHEQAEENTNSRELAQSGFHRRVYPRGDQRCPVCGEIPRFERPGSVNTWRLYCKCERKNNAGQAYQIP